MTPKLNLPEYRKNYFQNRTIIESCITNVLCFVIPVKPVPAKPVPAKPVPAKPVPA